MGLLKTVVAVVRSKTIVLIMHCIVYMHINHVDSTSESPSLALSENMGRQLYFPQNATNRISTRVAPGFCLGSFIVYVT